jgi:hypothetical protein
VFELGDGLDVEVQAVAMEATEWVVGANALTAVFEGVERVDAHEGGAGIGGVIDELFQET